MPSWGNTMPRGIYKRAGRPKTDGDLDGIAAAMEAETEGTPSEEAAKNAAALNLTSNREEVVRLLKLERERFMVRVKIIDAALKVFEGA